MIGLFMALIDVTIVNISIPQLQHDLDAPVETVSWVLNAYNIMFAVLLVSMGRLADQFGRRRFFLIGMTIFTVGSLLCALAWSINALIAFRVVQAVGAGILAPIALATTALVFPPDQRGLGLAMMAVVANAPPALGPPIGGVLIELRELALDLRHQRPDRRPRHRARAADRARDPRPPRRHERRLVGNGDARRVGLLPHLRAREGQRLGLGLDARSSACSRRARCWRSRSRSRSATGVIRC